MENVIKSQNLSNVVNLPKRTIFAPINSAWATASSSGIHLPYSTILRNLRYQIVEEIYYAQDLKAHNYTLITDYASTTIITQCYPDGKLTVLSNGVSNANGGVIELSTIIQANDIRTDILTNHGVIHLIDKVLIADPNAASF